MIMITHANVILTLMFWTNIFEKEREKIKYRIITALVERLTLIEEEEEEQRGETILGIEKWIAEHARHSDLLLIF